MLILVAVLAASPALAHHVSGGVAPQTAFHGLLSGLAHPVIGLDHLAFIVLVGLAAAGTHRRIVGPAVFIGATLAGTLVHLAGVTFPLAEVVVAASVVVLGALLFHGRQVRGAVALSGFAFAGLFHGWAYGGAVIGSAPMPIVAYLIGFALVQFAIAAGVARLASAAVGTAEGLIRARGAAAVCLGIGLVFLVEQAERFAFG
ncbi:MAG: HupE/UreJ family protein [Alphaproteobacteria bacterium]|nr:HupE/UreJ family protein [Alphaproteobacteria bacterium]